MASAEDILWGERCAACGEWVSACLCASPGELRAQPAPKPGSTALLAPEVTGETFGEATQFAIAIAAGAVGALIALLAYS